MTQEYKFIDLFCGIGGFHVALENISKKYDNKYIFKCVLACDIDKYCREVYKNNFNIDPLSDIKLINPRDIPDFDILCAGFPCQAFSNAGKKKTFNDSRGTLFDEIIKIISVKNPKFIFLENVKHILRVDDGKVLDHILTLLDKHNYMVQLETLSPHEYGIPQQRERVFFICIKKDIYINSNIKLLYPKHSNICLDNYLQDYKEIDEKYHLPKQIIDVLDAWDIMIKQFNVDEKISPTILINEFYTNYSVDEFKQLPKWKQDYIEKNRPLYEKYKIIWDEWYKKYIGVLNKREIYCKLEWQVGTIKKNDSIFNYFIQLRQSGIRVKKVKYFPTLVAISQIPIYAKERRYITPRECARLQSFPDDFLLHIDDGKSYKQLGNSVNVYNVMNIIESTLIHYK